MKVLIVDGDNKAYSFANATGFSVSMVSGFVGIISRLYKKFRPDVIFVAWEGMHSFRKDLDQNYKLGRSRLPNNVYLELQDVREIIKGLGVINVASNSFEADDSMMTLVSRVLKYGSITNVFISSEDKDLYQCMLRSNVFIETQSTKFGKTYDHMVNSERFDEYFGFNVKYWSFYQFLIGDNCDCVKGVPGIGPKGAIILMTQSWIDFLGVDDWNESPNIDRELFSMIVVKPKHPIKKLIDYINDGGDIATMWKMVKLVNNCDLILDRKYDEKYYLEQCSLNKSLSSCANLMHNYTKNIDANFTRLDQYLSGK